MLLCKHAREINILYNIIILNMYLTTHVLLIGTCFSLQ